MTIAELEEELKMVCRRKKRLEDIIAQLKEKEAEHQTEKDDDKK